MRTHRFLDLGAKRGMLRSFSDAPRAAASWMQRYLDFCAFGLLSPDFRIWTVNLRAFPNFGNFGLCDLRIFGRNGNPCENDTFLARRGIFSEAPGIRLIVGISNRSFAIGWGFIKFPNGILFGYPAHRTFRSDTIPGADGYDFDSVRSFSPRADFFAIYRSRYELGDFSYPTDGSASAGCSIDGPRPFGILMIYLSNSKIAAWRISYSGSRNRETWARNLPGGLFLAPIYHARFIRNVADAPAG